MVLNKAKTMSECKINDYSMQRNNHFKSLISKDRQ